MEIDSGDVHNGSKYVTLACQWSPPVDKVETVHLKVTFCNAESSDDRGTTVMQACAVVAGDARTNASGVYEGVVSVNEAAEDKSVSAWLQDARVSLIDQCITNDGVDNCGGKQGTTEYVHCLQQLQNENGVETIILSWKLKHKFCTVALGSIRLSKVTVPSELVGQMSVKFIKPLICCLLTEQKRHNQVTSAATITTSQLLKDNQQLLEQLKSMTESRQRDDERMMARFLEILNKKKLRIAEMQHELSQLKQQQNVGETVSTIKVEEKELSTVTKGRRGRGTGRSRGGYKKTEFNLKVKDEQLDNNEVVFKKQRTDCTTVQNLKPILLDVGISADTVVDKKKVVNFSVAENIMVDPFEAATQVDPICMTVQNSEPVLMDVEVSAAIAIDKKEVVDFPVAENIIVDPFEEDTQVDPISDDSPVSLSPESLPWLQQILPMEPQLQSSPIQPQLQSSPIQPQLQSLSTQPQAQSSSLQQPSEQKSVLDSLWYGIV